MAQPGTKTLVSDVIDVLDSFRILYARSQDIVSRYFDIDIAGTVNALPNGTDKVPDTPITKDDILGAITALQQFNNFMNNQAVAQNTYRVTCNKVSALKEQS